MGISNKNKKSKNNVKDEITTAQKDNGPRNDEIASGSEAISSENKKKVNYKQTVAIAILFLVIGFFGYFALRELAPGPQQKVAVVVPEGSSVNDISKILSERRVIGNSLVFKFYVFASGKTDKLMPGRYILKQSSPYRTVIKELVSGPEKIFYKLTIPEGFTLKQIGARLSKVGGLSRKEYDILSTEIKLFKYDFLKYNTSGTLEGYLFPETYRLDAETQLAEIINIMLKQFEKEYQSIKKRKVPIKLNIHQIITIASLVEREAKLKDEQPLVAAVIYNRLKKKMKLEIDASIQYALQEQKRKLTLRDLEIKSPYNTYKNTGLPPSPIGSPGKGALQAALNPAKVNYLYYVLVDEKSGKHFFTDNYQEFIKAKKSKNKQ